VPSFYDIDRANARIPELRETLLGLRELRGEVIALRDRIVELNAPWAIVAGGSNAGPTPAGPTPASTPASTPAGATRAEVEEETRMLRLRLQGMVDQMQAAAARIDGWGIQLRQIETGLVDFPALVSGRPVWLCWRLGEGEVAWWHEVSEGFEGHRRLEDLT
jgi:hypothetical protein